MNRRLSLLLLATACAATTLPAAADDYPSKALRIIVPYAAGGGVDNIARPVAAQLSKRFKQAVVVDNRPGASGNIGADAVAKAVPDGYTLLMGATFLGFNRATMKNVPYDAAKDLTPIARLAESPLVLVVSADAAFKSVADLVVFMKAHPEQSSYGAVGSGAPATLIFARNTGTTPVQILYKGGAAAMPDLLSGRVDFMIQTSSEVMPLIKSGKLRALAVTGPTRFPYLPSVPTMKEAGVADLEIVVWWGLFAPAKTPAGNVERLSVAALSVLADPEVSASLTRQSIVPVPLPAAAFKPFYESELKAYQDAARKFNLTVE